jgi:hypothetical protein
MLTRTLFALILFIVSVAPTQAAQTNIMPMPKLQFFSNQGLPLSGGKIYTCQPGTSCGPGSVTLKSSYTDSTGVTPNANPVVLDSAGRGSIWITGFYKIAVYDSASSLIYTQDNISSSGAGSNGLQLFLDATTGSIVYNLNGSNDVRLCKTDATVNVITITDTTPRTVPLDPLSLQGECVHLILNGSTWYVE